MTGLSRRTALSLLAASTASSLNCPAFAQGVEGRKFVFVILRGALDGLATLIPDDHEIDSLREQLLPGKQDRLDLGNGFRLHPALGRLKAIYDAGDAAFIHAAATHYRDRSHFDGQDVLETLAGANVDDGWLNRAMLAVGNSGIAVGPAMPRALRGEGPATNWSPPIYDAASDALLNRLADLYTSNSLFSNALARAREMNVTLGEDMANRKGGGGLIAEARASMRALGTIMAAENGPGVGMVSIDGWDTHVNQPGILQRQLSALDAGLGEFMQALGPHWHRTAIVITSEFGRTARVNGTNGTDHGTGGVMILAGGAVNGGDVYGDWPGLKDRDLYERRDLYPVNDISGAIKGLLRDHLGIDRRTLNNLVLPGSGRPLDGLVSC